MLNTYFVVAPKSGMVKIGKASDVDKRLSGLKTGSPEPLELLLILPHQTPYEEHQLHWRFNPYHSHREWFEYRGDLKEFITEKRCNPAPTEKDCLVFLSKNLPDNDERRERVLELRKNDTRVEGYEPPSPSKLPRGLRPRVNVLDGTEIDPYRSPIFDQLPVYVVMDDPAYWDYIQGRWRVARSTPPKTGGVLQYKSTWVG